jgi:DNA polymerase-3 subunit alpha
MVPQNPANPVTLEKAIADEPRFAEERKEPIVDRLLVIAQKLEGLYRHASTHAAGIVIGDRPLDRLVPLARDPRSGMKVTQFNMKWVEPAGLVKFDFLGLKTLTVLDLARQMVAKRGIEIDLLKIPLDDQKTFEMLQRGETVGVFQVESAGMRRALVDMRPDRFEDLIALVALYRPGPMANIPTYCSRKLGREPVEYAHPWLQPILEPTYGIITYQEQVQQIARDLAGYTLAQADLLRRAMGKKIKAEMDAQRGNFIKGATERGIDEATATSIFDACAKFAEYGFNKSHSAPYAFITYQTAYMKANYPAELIAASMELEAGNTEKIAEFRREALRLGIAVEPPSINRSGVAFEVQEGRIVYSLAAIKGVGAQAIEHLVATRGAKPFRDLADFGRRINPRLLNKRVLESLVCAGAFDELEPDRARVFAGVDRILGIASREQDDAAVGQGALFGMMEAEQPLVLPDAEPWLAAEKLKREHDAVGFYLSAHPLDDYAKMLKDMKVSTWAEFTQRVHQGDTFGRLAATITAKQERRTRTGNRMAAVQFSDPTGSFEGVLFSEGLNQYRDLLEPGRSVLIGVAAEDRPEGINIRVETVQSLDTAIRNLKQIKVFLRDEGPLPSLQKQIAVKGEGEVSLVLILDDGAREIEMKLPGRYAVSPQVASALRAVRGVEQVEMA